MTSIRDYVTEMRDLIKAETTDTPYSAPIVASRIVEKLRATDPDLLAGWLDANAVQYLRMAIGERDRGARSHARATHKRRAFAEAVDEGDVQPTSEWLTVPFVVNDDDERKPLRLMRAPDLDYAAREYDNDAAAAKFEAAFMRALKKRIGTGTVGDHFTEAQIVSLRISLHGRAA